MKCFILEMRDCGAVVERGEMTMSLGHDGIVEIVNTREYSVGRSMKLAILKDAVGNVIKTLYSVSIFSLGGEKLGLTGYERTTSGNVLRDVCQRWIVRAESNSAQSRMMH